MNKNRNIRWNYKPLEFLFIILSRNGKTTLREMFYCIRMERLFIARIPRGAKENQAEIASLSIKLNVQRKSSLPAAHTT